MTKAILSEKKIHLDSKRYEKIVKESKNQQKNFVSNEKIHKRQINFLVNSKKPVVLLNSVDMIIMNVNQN